MKVLVCGGRNYFNSNRMFAVLDRFHERFEITQIISGGKDGADGLAWEWAMMRQIQCVSTPAEWKKLALAAGPIRNRRQADELKPEVGIAFPGGTGTHDMVDYLESKGVVVHKIDWKDA